MITNIIIGLALIGFTVVIQAYGTNFWLNHIEKKYMVLTAVKFDKKSTKLLINTALFLILVHFIQVGIWAFTYYTLPNITEFETFEKAMYFSLVTFTTLGYGDISLSESNRVLSGFEAMNGILLIGWSTAYIFNRKYFLFVN